MKSFNQFITESKILNEGGNAPFINRETGEKLGDAQKIDLNKVNRTKLAKSLQLLFPVSGYLSVHMLYTCQYDNDCYLIMIIPLHDPCQYKCITFVLTWTTVRAIVLTWVAPLLLFAE